MNRETIEFESSGHKIVANTYITGAEAREAKKILFAGVAIEPQDPGQPVVKPKIPMENSIAYERAQLQKCLVTIDDKPAMDVLDALPSDEYDAIVADARANLPKVFLVKPVTPGTPSPSSSN